MRIERTLALVALLAATACNDSQFAGSGAKAAQTKPNKAVLPEKDSKSSGPATTKPGGDKGPLTTSPDPKSPSTKMPSTNGPLSPVPGTASDASRVDPTTDSANSHFPISTLPNPLDDSSSGKGPGFVDLLSGILSKGGPAIDEGSLGKQPDDNNVIFGDEKTFHIGDGLATQSSCQDGIGSYPVSGKQYLFEFDVLADGMVSVDIGLVCGVDYSDTNLVFLAQNGQPIGQTTPLPVGASSFQLPSQQLAKGHYQIAVESRTGTQDPEGNPNDADDYILGKVHIQSQGAKIKIGKVYVN